MNNHHLTQLNDYQKLFEEIALFEKEAKEREQLLHFERELQVGTRQGSFRQSQTSSHQRTWSQQHQPEPNFFISQSNITGDASVASSGSKEARLLYREAAVLVDKQPPNSSLADEEDAHQPRIVEVKDDNRAQNNLHEDHLNDFKQNLHLMQDLLHEEDHVQTSKPLTNNADIKNSNSKTSNTNREESTSRQLFREDTHQASQQDRPYKESKSSIHSQASQTKQHSSRAEKGNQNHFSEQRSETAHTQARSNDILLHETSFEGDFAFSESIVHYEDHDLDKISLHVDQQSAVLKKAILVFINTILFYLLL